MRRYPVLSVVLAAILVASVAVAAKTTLTANISSLQASGISGVAEFSMIGNGQVRVHESLSGLEPGVEYSSSVYTGSTTCGAGGSVAEIGTFTANAAGKANINTVAPVQITPLSTNASVSVVRVTDSALLACGEIQ